MEATVSHPASDEPSDDDEQAPGHIPPIYMTVRYLAPENAKPSVEARQAFYDALKEMARSEYDKLARLGRGVGLPDTGMAMASFSLALEFVPSWFEGLGLVPRPEFDTNIFVTDAIESIVRQAANGEPFGLRAYPWAYEGDGPSVNIQCHIWHPLVRPPSDGEMPAGPQTLSMTELRDSAVSLFTKGLHRWLEAVYDHAKKTGVVAKDARTLERDMRRLVQKQVIGYSPAEIVALEQGARPSDLATLDHRTIDDSAKRAVHKAIVAAAERLGLEVVHLPPGPKSK
jgi:hypothetical protein